MSMLARKCGSGTYQADPWPLGRHILVLGDPARVAGSKSRSRMRHRQRTNLARLGCTVSVAGGLAVPIGGLVWAVFGVSAVAFAAYALLVAQVRAREAERREKVRDIRPARAATSATRPGFPAAQSDASGNVRIQRWVG